MERIRRIARSIRLIHPTRPIRVAPALPGLRAQVIHADMSLDNVLYGDGLRVSGIVDFGDMTHSHWSMTWPLPSPTCCTAVMTPSRPLMR